MRRRLFATIVAVAAVTAACGNSDGERGAGTTAAGGDDGGGGGETVAVDAPGVTDTEIHVEGIASVTNPIGGTYDTADDGVQAYFDMVNDQGGVHGRDLVLDGVRDDKLANNDLEATALADSDSTFAALPVAVLLFTGADTLVQAGVPTFGWNINEEWSGTEDDPRANLFGQAGSFNCIGCAQPFIPFLAERTDRHRVGLLAYTAPQSASCLDGWKESVEQWGGPEGTEVVFSDASLAFGTTDLSVQVQKMKEQGVDFVATCMDNNGVVTLAKEMKKQQLDAIQLLPNAYDQAFMDEYGDLLEGSYVLVDFSPIELDDSLKPPGLENYEEWIERSGGVVSENSIVGWLNADLFVTGLREAGPDFDRQKVVDAINSMTDYTADGMLDPVNWKEYGHTKRSDTQCAVYLEVEGSEMVPIEDDRIFTCFDISGSELVPVEG
jgi:ABC-type branched-subunit amino acid transport system substrate-binding protein